MNARSTLPSNVGKGDPAAQVAHEPAVVEDHFGRVLDGVRRPALEEGMDPAAEARRGHGDGGAVGDLGGRDGDRRNVRGRRLDARTTEAERRDRRDGERRRDDRTRSSQRREHGHPPTPDRTPSGSD